MSCFKWLKNTQLVEKICYDWWFPQCNSYFRFIAATWRVAVWWMSDRQAYAKPSCFHLNPTTLAIGIFNFLNLDVLQNFLINPKTDKSGGLPMSYVVHEPKLHNVNSKTEERPCQTRWLGMMQLVWQPLAFGDWLGSSAGEEGGKPSPWFS